MSTIRVRAELDVDITNETTARVAAESYLQSEVDSALLNGLRLETGPTMPIEVIDAILDSPQLLSIIVTTLMLGQGAQQIPMAVFSNLKVSVADDVYGDEPR